MADEPTLGDALARFRAANGLHGDDSRAETWGCRIGPLTLRLPNFGWRRRAVLAHDVHHVLTGYPCTMRGEFQMAAWEFAAGRMPHWGAAAFCLPLVAMGVAWSPRRQFLAYRAGRRAASLHEFAAVERLFGISLTAARHTLTAHRRAGTLWQDAVSFSGLTVASAALLLTPVVAIAVLLMLAA